MDNSITSFLIGILVGIVGLAIYQKSFDETELPIVPPDTFFVEVPVAPDTVFLDKIVVDRVPVVYRDTIYTDTGRVIVERDTVFVFEEKLLRSEKTFEFPHVKSLVLAWAETPVKKFDNRVIIDWQGHFDKVYAPELRSIGKRHRNKGRLEGAIAGILGTAGLVFLVK